VVIVYLFAAWPRPWRRWKPLKGHWELLKTPWLGDFVWTALILISMLEKNEK
jgi:hypothetical protein